MGCAPECADRPQGPRRSPTGSRLLLPFLSLPLLLFFFGDRALAQSEEDEECMMCHEDRDLYKEAGGRRISLYVNYSRFTRSVHAKQGCVSCHFDVDPDDLPHEDNLEKVDCSICHDTAVEQFGRSLHGEAVAAGRTLAPTCEVCHGKHDIMASSDPAARTYVMNIPALCGTCHKDGTSVSELRSMSADRRHVLEDYSESIHGAGLLQRGLIVTAVCTSCHKSHNILTHEDPRSSIHRDNIPNTCMQCHRQIESVHTQVINGELWEKRPHQLPICVDCHLPHQLRRVIYDLSLPDELCMGCHGDRSLSRTVNGEMQSLFVDQSHLAGSAHNDVTCIKCHTAMNPNKDPLCIGSGPVDCSMCHEAVVNEFGTSQHGADFAAGNPIAPYCTNCHGAHDILRHTDPSSPTFTLNVPALCGKCHREGEQAAKAYTGKEHEILRNYSMSIHGKGLLESGLLTTATCVSCHTAHHELPADDPRSSVHTENIASTCAQCHLGIYEKLRKSVHSPAITATEEKLPTCNDCHFSHTINRVDIDNFRQGIIAQCGTCHEKVTETYFDTFHGKVSKLGSIRTARCYDCHGSHEILKPHESASLLSSENIVATCGKCHPNSNVRFAGYLAHATHDDRETYPGLFWTFWFMTALLVSVFTFFGIHTMMWFPRALRERLKRRKAWKQDQGSTP